MTRRTDAHPDLVRPEAGAPFFSTWRLGAPERQRQAVEAVAAAWERRPWPTGRLLSYHVYTGHDGSTLMHHSQWADERAYEGFVKTRRQETVDEIDTAVPGIERLGLDRYRRYRSQERPAGDRRVPGLIVAVRIEFEQGAAARRREWVDLVLTALAGDEEGHRGLISAHFHLSQDGTHVLNYAEWEDDAAYDAALAAPGDGVASPNEQWARVQSYAGVKGFTAARYRHALGLVPE
ncbi:antibiotic biosynthesis monooxygenase [Streptomyces sp. NPDC088387]|uniref:antibiotic biosynthesis monooxygenase n=1 Tax=Streptomyces sp. NPDC088387 TaxID=3365859 RepID=UPI0038167CCE